MCEVISDWVYIVSDWVEEQMAPLVESMEPPRVPTYEDNLVNTYDEAHSLNWIHYLGTFLRFFLSLLVF